MINVYALGTRDLVPHEVFTFPCGELHVRVKQVANEPQEDGIVSSLPKYCAIEFRFENSVEVLELLFLVNALRYKGSFISELHLGYIPFSRQDRVASEGDCFSLEVFASLINSLNIPKVIVVDPHSDVSTALIKNCQVFTQHKAMFSKVNEIIETLSSDLTPCLVSPDGGALKKCYSLAKIFSLEVIECSKKRDATTGNISGVRVHAEGSLSGKCCILVDDICDGGRTFIECAKELRFLGAAKIYLLVSHGFFTKGVEVFSGLIDEVWCFNRGVVLKS